MFKFLFLAFFIVAGCGVSSNIESADDEFSGGRVLFRSYEFTPTESEKGQRGLRRNIKLATGDDLFVQARLAASASLWDEEIQVSELKITHKFPEFPDSFGISAFSSKASWGYEIRKSENLLVIEGLQKFVSTDGKNMVTRIPFVRWVVDCDDMRCASQKTCLNRGAEIAAFDTLGFEHEQDFRDYLQGINVEYNSKHPEFAGQKAQSINNVLMAAFTGNRAAWMFLMDLYSRPIEFGGKIDYEHEFEGALRESIRKAAPAFKKFMLQNDCEP